MDLQLLMISFLLPLTAAYLQNIPQFISQGSESVDCLGNIQAIVPNYTFSCTGTVVQWGACIQASDEQIYTIEFQVWRQSEGEDDDYSLVGRNCFMSSSQAATVPGCINLPVVQLGQTPIPVQPGDVVGFQFLYNEGGDESSGQDEEDRKRRDGSDETDSKAGVELSDTETGVIVWYQDEGQQGSGGNLICRNNSESNIDIGFGGFTKTTIAPVITASVVPTSLVPTATVGSTMSMTPEEPTFPAQSVVTPTETPAQLATTSVVPTATVGSTTSMTPEEPTFPAQSVVTPTETLATASASTTLLLSTSSRSPALNIAPTNSQPVEQSRTPATVRTSTQLPSTVQPSPTDSEEPNPENSSDTPANSSTSNEAIIGIVIGVLIFIIAVLVVLVIVFALRLRSMSRRQYTSGSGAHSVKFKLNSRRRETPEEDTRAIIGSPEYDYSLLGESTPTFARSGYSIVRLTSNPSRTSASVEGEYAYDRHMYETIEPQSPPTVTSNYTNQSTYRQSANYAEVSTLPRQEERTVVGSHYEMAENPSEPTRTYVPTEEERMAMGSHYEMAENPSEPTRMYVPTEEERTAMGSHYEMAEMHQYNTLKFFVEDQTYWAPASSTSGLYAQLAAKKYREIPRQHITQREELGSGQFGQVRKGLWQPQDSGGAALEIAVKTLKCDAPESDKVKFLQEAAIMGQFSHPNVIHLYGLVTVNTPIMIVLELMSNGDLRSYIRGLHMDQYPDSTKLEHLFLRFMQETAAGMAYLSGKSFVHRDLAARNILLDQNFTCKIGDFGLARDLMNETYYTSKGGQIPVKWTAPEAIFYKKYSPASDVWSYGMVLFEIWSLGRKPFQNLSNAEVINLVKTGYCQPPPPGCPRAVYKLMVDCWNPAHRERPTFKNIGGYLKGTDQNVLAWAEDVPSSKKARELGAPISESRHLYLDLQHQYKEQT